MKIADRICSWILVLGGLLHGVGSYLGYSKEPMTLLWALSASQLCLVVAAINLLRVERPADRPLAWICLVSSGAWAVTALIFGVLIGNAFDVRAMIHCLTAVALAVFSLRTALGAGSSEG